MFIRIIRDIVNLAIDGQPAIIRRSVLANISQGILLQRFGGFGGHGVEVLWSQVAKAGLQRELSQGCWFSLGSEASEARQVTAAAEHQRKGRKEGRKKELLAMRCFAVLGNV